MRLTESQKLILFTIAIGTLDTKDPVGGIKPEDRAALVSQVVSQQDQEPTGPFSLKELNHVGDNGSGRGKDDLQGEGDELSQYLRSSRGPD